MERTTARRIVEEAGRLYERGEMAFATYDHMRTALVNEQYDFIRRHWEMFGPKTGDKVSEHHDDVERERDALRARLAEEQEARRQEYDYANADAEIAAKRIRGLIAENTTLREQLAEATPIIAAVATAYVRSPQYSNPVLEFPNELETTEQPFAYHLRDLAEKWRADAEHAAQPSGDGGE